MLRRGDQQLAGRLVVALDDFSIGMLGLASLDYSFWAVHSHGTHGYLQMVSMQLEDWMIMEEERSLEENVVAR